MTYENAIDYLFKQLPNYQQQGTEAYKPGLNNIASFCNELGDPHHTFKSIHLAGTNGKGSTAHIIAAVLQKSGYQVGIYSSPHLIDFRERIKINGKYISKEKVVHFVQENTTYCETNQISFFEWTTALAFSYFAAEGVDFAIIETGLGGRLDSTNILRPILSIITSIGLDHTPILGTSLEEIAFEKAGIIKPTTPVLLGFMPLHLHSIFEQKAAELNAPLYFASKTADYRTHCDLKPAYQKDNLNLAFEASKLLIQMGYSNDFKKGIKNVVNATKFYGRWQVVSDTPKIILDCGHNAEGIEACIAELNQFEGKKHIVFGTVKDKDHSSILSLLPKGTIYYFCCPSNYRGMPADQLQTEAGFHNLTGSSYPTVSTAVTEAIETSEPNDVILITGSTFIVADALKEF
jgi:dihydrofolate synthase / folylpolyglutamate synthase